MQHIGLALWAYVMLEGIKFGYTVGWDIYLNLGRW